MNPTPCPICGRPPTIKGLPSGNVEIYHRCEDFYIELHGNGERDESIQEWNDVLKKFGVLDPVVAQYYGGKKIQT